MYSCGKSSDRRSCRKNRLYRFGLQQQKAIEGDPLILKQLQLEQNELEMLEHIVVQMEKERGLDRSAAIADMRFDFIERLCEQTVVKPKESKERVRSREN